MLTGFQADDWSIEHWQSYIAKLQAQKDEAFEAYRTLKEERRVTAKDRLRYMGRLDRLGEFIVRAKYEIAAIEKRQNPEGQSRPLR
ncbi:MULTISPECIES: hypothetical protein [Hyphomonas]